MSAPPIRARDRNTLRSVGSTALPNGKHDPEPADVTGDEFASSDVAEADGRVVVDGLGCTIYVCLALIPVSAVDSNLNDSMRG